MNLLKQFDSFLLHQASDEIHQKERSKMSQNRYFRTLAKKMDKIGQKPSEWLYQFETKLPTKLLTLDEFQKRSLLEYVKTLSIQEFSWYMALLCRMLDHLDQNDELESELGQMLIQNHAYLKTEVFPSIFPEQNKQFIKLTQKRKQEKLNLPRCPRCQSDKIVSNGSTRWLCNNCGKQFKKKLG